MKKRLTIPFNDDIFKIIFLDYLLEVFKCSEIHLEIYMSTKNLFLQHKTQISCIKKFNVHNQKFYNIFLSFSFGKNHPTFPFK